MPARCMSARSGRALMTSGDAAMGVVHTNLDTAGIQTIAVPRRIRQGGPALRSSLLQFLLTEHIGEQHRGQVALAGVR